MLRRCVREQNVLEIVASPKKDDCSPLNSFVKLEHTYIQPIRLPTMAHNSMRPSKLQSKVFKPASRTLLINHSVFFQNWACHYAHVLKFKHIYSGDNVITPSNNTRGLDCLRVFRLYCRKRSYKRVYSLIKSLITVHDNPTANAVMQTNLILFLIYLLAALFPSNIGVTCTISKPKKYFTKMYNRVINIFKGHH